MTTEQKLEILKQEKAKLSFKNKCELLTINRTSADYQLHHSQKQEKETADLKIKQAIDQIHLEFPYYGFRPMTHALKRRFSWVINQKKVQRIMRKYGLLSQIRKLFKKGTTNSQHQLAKYPNLIKDLIISGPNQIWGADITYVKLVNGFCYLAIILDLFSRKIKGWAISKNLDHYSLTIPALKIALSKYLAPLIHHSDQGVQYCCLDYVDLLKEQNIQISMSDKANPLQNNICESFFKTLKYNEIYLNEYDNFEEAVANIERFIDLVYNQKRLHSSLGYLPPDEFEQNYFKNQPDNLFSELRPKNDSFICPVRPA